jgi:hypothetical protein
LNNSETNDFFVNDAKIQESNCILSRGKIKKLRGGFSMNKGPIAKSQNFRGTIKSRQYQLRNKTAPFQRTLIFFSRPDQEEEKPPRAPRCVSITTVTVLRVRFILLGERMTFSGFIKARERPRKRQLREKRSGERTRLPERKTQNT